VTVTVTVTVTVVRPEKSTAIMLRYTALPDIYMYTCVHACKSLYMHACIHTYKKLRHHLPPSAAVLDVHCSEVRHIERDAVLVSMHTKQNGIETQEIIS